MGVATNLRLSPAAAAALRVAADEQGRPQQELLREAVDRYLGLSPELGSRERAVAAGIVRRPAPFRHVPAWIELPPGVTSLDLLDRDER